MPLALPISRRCRSATLQIGKHSGTLGIMISGFDQASETIDLTRIGADGAITNADTATDQITVTGSLCSLTLQRLDRRPRLYDAIRRVNGTNLIACFCRGTLILTDKGEVAVERLAIGDRFVTLSGAAKAIVWIGHRAYDPRFIAGKEGVLPVRIAADALADGVPARDR